MHVNDTFGQSMAKGVAALLPKLSLPFKIVDTISYDPAAKDLTVEVSKAKATNAELPAAGVPAERRDRAAARDGEAALEPDGHRQPRLARACTRSSTPRRSASTPRTAISNAPWYNPKSEITKRVRDGVQEADPEGRARVPRPQRGLHLRGDPDRRRRVQAREEHRSARRSPTRSARPTSPPRIESPRRADQVQRQGPGRRQPLGVHPEPHGKPTVVLPEELPKGSWCSRCPKARVESTFASRRGALMPAACRSLANAVVIGHADRAVYGLMALGLSAIFGVMRSSTSRMARS